MGREFYGILMLIFFIIVAVALAVKSESQTREHEKIINEIEEKNKEDQKNENKWIWKNSIREDFRRA